MFGVIFHLQPVGRRRAVPELVQYRAESKINEWGVERISADGNVDLPWLKVTRVLKLREAYLVEKANGAMPLPFRCMSMQQRVEFERLAGARLSSVDPG